jgi:tryptophanyl-tRNA synthetase
MKKIVEDSLAELKDTLDGINETIEKNGYIRFPNNFDIFGYGKNNELNNRYICYTPNMPQILKMKKEDIAIVSGFGATNSPTAGTLSMILKLIDFQKKSGLYTHVIVSDFGAYNARHKNIVELLELTKQFENFIEKMGFDSPKGELRTHNFQDHARTFALVSSVLRTLDFMDNGEATDKMYERLNLRGNDFSTMVDHAFTASDVLLPILRDGKKGIIVPCGLEEYYHSNIGAIALERMKSIDGLKDLVPDDVQIGAIYSKLITGFFPYVKMSKSIPDSSLNLGNDEKDIYNKIMNVSARNEFIILQVMELASNWSNEKIDSAISTYNNRFNDMKKWIEFKQEYLDFFLDAKKVWDSCKRKTLNLRKVIYK